MQAIEVFEPAIAALDAAVRGDASNTFRIHVGLRNLDLYPLQGTELAGFDAAIFDPPRAGARAQAKRLGTKPDQNNCGRQLQPSDLGTGCQTVGRCWL